MKYPFAPLAGAMGLTEAHACRVLNISGRVAQEYRRDGMSRKVADRRAVQAGLHPYEVWPEMLEDDLADVEMAEAERTERKRASARHRAARRHERLRNNPDYLARREAYRQRARRAINASRRRYYQENRDREIERQREYRRRRSEAA